MGCAGYVGRGEKGTVNIAEKVEGYLQLRELEHLVDHMRVGLLDHDAKVKTTGMEGRNGEIGNAIEIFGQI